MGGGENQKRSNNNSVSLDTFVLIHSQSAIDHYPTPDFCSQLIVLRLIVSTSALNITLRYHIPVTQLHTTEYRLLAESSSAGLPTPLKCFSINGPITSRKQTSVGIVM